MSERKDRSGRERKTMSPEETPKKASSKTLIPPFKRENNLPEDKVLYWLANNVLNLQTSDIKLSKEVKTYIINKILDGELEYGNIPPAYIVPYLKFSEVTAFFIKEVEIEKSDNDNNIKVFYDMVEENYLKQASLKTAFLDFFKQNRVNKRYSRVQRTGNLYLSMDEYDNFPTLHIKTDDISFYATTYGIKNLYAYFGITKLYSISKLEYKMFYSRAEKSSLGSYIAYSLYVNNLVKYVKYNNSRTKTNSYLDIMNLPSLIRNIPDVESSTWWKSIREMNVDVEHPVRIFSEGGEYKILAYLRKKKLLDEGLLTFLEKTNLPLGWTLNEEIDKAFVKFNYLTYTSPLTVNFLNYMDERGLRDLVKYTKYDAKKYNEEEFITYCKDHFDDLLGALEEVELTHSLGDPASLSVPDFPKLEDFPPLDRLSDKIYTASRDIKLHFDTSDNASPVYAANILCNMKDYGYPGVDKKNTNKYPDQMVTSIERLINLLPNKDAILEMISQELGIDVGLLNLGAFTRILKRGFINPLPIDPKILKRNEKWKSLTVDQKSVMAKLYKKTELSASEFINETNALEVCENMIAEYDPETLEGQMAGLGMILPVNTNALDYFISSLPLYIRIMLRGEEWPIMENLNVPSLEIMCDLEIIEFVLEGYIGHTSREDLVRRATELLNGGEMFVLVRNPEYIDISNEEKVNEGIRTELYKFMSKAPSLNPFNLVFRYTPEKSADVKSSEFTITELDMFNKDIISPGRVDFDERTEEQKLADQDEATPDSLRVFQLSVYDGKRDSKNGFPIPKILSPNGITIFTQVINYARIYLDQLLTSYIESGDIKEINSSFETEMDKDTIDEDTNVGVIISTNDSLNYIQKKIERTIMESRANYALEKQSAERFLSLSSKVHSFKLGNRELTMNVKQLIVEGLLIAFDCGMIQRQWNGVRGEYPYSREQAGTEEGFENKKDLIVGEQLHLLSAVFTLLEELSKDASDLFQGLSIKTMITGSTEEKFITEEIKQGDGKVVKTMKMLYNDITKGEAKGGLCIRLGSAKFIWTAYYWLKVFGNVDVLGAFDVLKTKYFG